MEKISKLLLVNLFNTVCEVYDLPIRKDVTTRNENPVQKDFYSKDWYHLDYNSYYGGYSFRVVNAKTGESFAFNCGSGRYTAKEAYCFLSGLLAAKNLLK